MLYTVPLYWFSVCVLVVDGLEGRSCWVAVPQEKQIVLAMAVIILEVIICVVLVVIVLILIVLIMLGTKIVGIAFEKCFHIYFEPSW